MSCMKPCGWFMSNINFRTDYTDSVSHLTLSSIMFGYFSDEINDTLIFALGIIALFFLILTLLFLKCNHRFKRSHTFDRFLISFAIVSVLVCALNTQFDALHGLSDMLSITTITVFAIVFFFRAKCMKRKEDGPLIMREMLSENER